MTKPTTTTKAAAKAAPVKPPGALPADPDGCLEGLRTERAGYETRARWAALAADDAEDDDTRTARLDEAAQFAGNVNEVDASIAWVEAHLAYRAATAPKTPPVDLTASTLGTEVQSE